MPLIVGSDGRGLVEDFDYDFNVDIVSCRDDRDGDGVQTSCDNANNAIPTFPTATTPTRTGA